MIFSFKTESTVLLAILMALAVNPYGQDGRLDTLTQGLFLHTYVSAIGPADPIIQRVIEGKKIEASPGAVVNFQNGKTERWTMHTANSAGWFKGNYLHSGYGLFTINSHQDMVALLEAMGNDLVYVNGVPREGNKYAYKDMWDSCEPAFNFSVIPIRLRKGKNQLLFVCSRSILKVKLEDIPSGILFNVKHPTVPNFLVGQSVDYYAAVTVVNATDMPLRDAFIKAYNDSEYDAETRLPLIQPMSMRKVGFKLVGPAPSSVGTTTIKLALLEGPGAAAKEIAHSEISIKIVPPNATHDVTFISSIDGSVQYYAIVPPRGPDNAAKRKRCSFPFMART